MCIDEGRDARAGVVAHLESQSCVYESATHRTQLTAVNHDRCPGHVAAGIGSKIGNHAFRATGITAYLKNGGTLDNAAAMGYSPMWQGRSLRLPPMPICDLHNDHQVGNGFS